MTFSLRLLLVVDKFCIGFNSLLLLCYAEGYRLRVNFLCLIQPMQINLRILEYAVFHSQLDTLE